ncbi:MAG: hypothetical protein A3G52_02165 [Candidatus Taylorbacteria bacterium RIFCSPLOWO2_12_FULL_43_20]|uniref:YdbS-like PH domain-containing protein n=1 Tax=Candidatus Taylorbacteria bacterium RIFCSPLOWO2_12_FULL_43_20 TaxID=1802332 RepID=A0A1G2P2Z4_9BACT|nr:MAG: hypothetical protein A2825_01050 [Candidatus Taylorbacteria bacterium RIFCSPHIGHO2_01_FULL_43_120]OHA23583.1 MAG: hypothetical protein A3B98_00495 [Candidatus Taylorbacteria bacterium RIFCSPHIGHO2_02_FULL_43_55]OHA28882.1 MAG: hypothetical protein A3E92_04380 [Candidatus Taylorbacteria bacterium RIFCSPHIGHO2_12_FULL_42_34]OHA30288.1 MAG: hypothetical protein A3B09_03965 [Candidatus Taylorbacteria bacterium RIFCSPLOWO2_01_FULL_43_83]OHA39340.1 MAG: hypothetical protein A3H58_04130 [Candi
MLKLNDNEIVILEIRKHWFIIFAKGFFLFVAALLPLVIYSSYSDFSSLKTVHASGNFASLSLFLYSCWLMVLWAVFFIEWTDYYLDVWYVTNKRVIDVDQKGIFYREIATLYYNNLQDVTTKTKGFVETVFNFGDIYMQTAGEKREFIIRSAANPEEAKHIILNEYQKNLSAADKDSYVANNAVI